MAIVVHEGLGLTGCAGVVKLAKHIFGAKEFREAAFMFCVLWRNFRSEDEVFSRALAACAFGAVNEELEEYLSQRIEVPLKNAVKLRQLRAEVDALNNNELAELEGSAVQYVRVDNVDDAECNAIGMSGEGSAGLLAVRPEITLKPGARVMCLMNHVKKNGAMGVVRGFVASDLETDMEGEADRMAVVRQRKEQVMKWTQVCREVWDDEQEFESYGTLKYVSLSSLVSYSNQASTHTSIHYVGPAVAMPC